MISGSTQTICWYITRKRKHLNSLSMVKIYTTGEVLLRGGNNTLTVDGTLRTDPQTKLHT